MEKQNHVHMESITSPDYIIGRSDRFEPKEEIFIAISGSPNNGVVYGIIPYLDHHSKGYYFLTNTIDGTTSKPRVVLGLTEEAFADKALVNSILAHHLT